MIFIHGGSWRGGRSSQFTVYAEPFVKAGANFVVVDFTNVGETNGDLFPMVDQCRRAVAWVYRNAATFGGNPDPKFPWTNRTVSTVRLSYDQSGLLVRSKCLIAVLLYLQSPSDSKLSQAHSSRRERRVHRENVSHRLLRRSQASQLVTDPLNGPSNFARLSRRVERAHSSESAGLH